MNCYTKTPSGNSSQNLTNAPWNNVNVPKVTGTPLTRAVTVAKYLMANAGLTKMQAAAVVGVYIDENHCNPASYMKAEAKGQGAKGTGGFGYGAGIASWTGVEFKNTALKQAGISPYTPIETLTLEQQAKMVVGNIKGNMKHYYDALRRCQNIEDASATCVVMTYGVGHSKNWRTHPTPQEAQAASDYYGRANDRSYGKSEHHWNGYARRLGYAKQVLALL